jgi:hypothetical protein
LLLPSRAFANGESASDVPAKLSPMANRSPVFGYSFREWRIGLRCSVEAFADGELTSGVPMELSPLANGSPLLFWSFRQWRMVQINQRDSFFNQNRRRL